MERRNDPTNFNEDLGGGGGAGDGLIFGEGFCIFTSLGGLRLEGFIFAILRYFSLK